LVAKTDEAPPPAPKKAKPARKPSAIRGGAAKPVPAQPQATAAADAPSAFPAPPADEAFPGTVISGIGAAVPAGEAPPAARTWAGTPQLSLAARDWPAPDGPFREAANAARRHLADGNPEAAARAAANAAKAASTRAEKAEAR